MHLVIAYHGNGKREVEEDLKLLWDHVRDFAKARSMRHIYCFQAVRDGQGADTLIVIQYDNVFKAKPCTDTVQGLALNMAHSQTHHRDKVDYWFYVRNRSQKQGGLK